LACIKFDLEKDNRNSSIDDIMSSVISRAMKMRPTEYTKYLELERMLNFLYDTKNYPGYDPKKKDKPGYEQEHNLIISAAATAYVSFILNPVNHTDLKKLPEGLPESKIEHGIFYVLDKMNLSRVIVSSASAVIMRRAFAQYILNA